MYRHVSHPLAYDKRHHLLTAADHFFGKMCNACCSLSVIFQVTSFVRLAFLYIIALSSIA
jgi:hypothetical protein